VAKAMMGRAPLTMYNVIGAGRWARRGLTAQNLHGTKIEHHPQQTSQDRQFPHLEGDHLHLMLDNRLGILGNHKQEAEFIS